VNNSGQKVKSVKILCIFGNHVSNTKELTNVREYAERNICVLLQLLLNIKKYSCFEFGHIWK
jgi:hypothetical protein